MTTRGHARLLESAALPQLVPTIAVTVDAGPHPGDSAVTTACLCGTQLPAARSGQAHTVPTTRTARGTSWIQGPDQLVRCVATA